MWVPWWVPVFRVLSGSSRAAVAGAQYAIGVYSLLRFAETPVFTASVRRLLEDEQYRALQLALLLRPEQGPLIPGGGGLRKIRWGAE